MNRSLQRSNLTPVSMTVVVIAKDASLQAHSIRQSTTFQGGCINMTHPIRLVVSSTPAPLR